MSGANSCRRRATGLAPAGGPDDGSDRWAVAGAATYGSEVYGGHLAANPSNNHTVDWWRFDAFTDYKLTDNVTVRLSGINLTNELYYDAIYQAADTFAFVAPGRAGYLTVNFKY